MEFSRQEYWSELPFLSPEDLPDPGIESESPALQVNSSPSEPPGNASLITLFYSTSCRHWAGCSEFDVDWKRKRLRGARTTDIFYITHWFVAFQTKRNWGSDMVERKGADPEPTVTEQISLAAQASSSPQPGQDVFRASWVVQPCCLCLGYTAYNLSWFSWAWG